MILDSATRRKRWKDPGWSLVETLTFNFRIRQGTGYISKDTLKLATEVRGELRRTKERLRKCVKKGFCKRVECF